MTGSLKEFGVRGCQPPAAELRKATDAADPDQVAVDQQGRDADQQRAENEQDRRALVTEEADYHDAGKHQDEAAGGCEAVIRVLGLNVRRGS